MHLVSWQVGMLTLRVTTWPNTPLNSGGGVPSLSMAAALRLCCPQPLHPQSLVGLPLRAFVNVFEDWNARFGEDTSLLSGLWVRALEDADDTWRVGVHVPGGSSADAKHAQVRSGARLAPCCPGCAWGVTRAARHWHNRSLPSSEDVPASDIASAESTPLSGQQDWEHAARGPGKA